MKVKIVNEVKRSDGLWRFACGDVFMISGNHLKNHNTRKLSKSAVPKMSRNHFRISGNIFMISGNYFMLSRNYVTISGNHFIILQEPLEEGAGAHFQQGVPQISGNDENVNPQIFGFSVITCIDIQIEQIWLLLQSKASIGTLAMYHAKITLPLLFRLCWESSLTGPKCLLVKSCFYASLFVWHRFDFWVCGGRTTFRFHFFTLTFLAAGPCLSMPFHSFTFECAVGEPLSRGETKSWSKDWV